MYAELDTGSETIFAEDEFEVKRFNPRWSEEDLLEQEGLFFLKDVGKVLEIEQIKVKQKADELRMQGKSPYEVMGARKVWQHWMVRMKVFGPYYLKNLKPRVRQIKPQWNSNTLLIQKGVFRLSHVAKLLPFSAHQLRYQAKTHPSARSEMGVWKDPVLNAFVVNMEVFGPWVRRTWEGDFHRKQRALAH